VTFTAAVLWTLVRALVVTALAGPCVVILERWLARAEGPARWQRLALILTPFLFPELLVGYAYIPWVAGLPRQAEGMTACLLLVRVIPVGVVARLLTPASLITRSAIHCRRLLQRTSRDARELWWLWLCGPVRQASPALVLMLLVTFQEFELAALFKATSWTDWLFVQQVGGLPLSESLRVSLLPVGIQVTLLGWAFFAVQRGPVDPAAEEAPGVYRYDTGIAVGLIGLMWCLAVVVPTVSLLGGLPAGLWQLAGQPARCAGLFREMLTGLAIAGVAASLAWLTVGFFLRVVHQPGLLALCCLPGLLGSLILGLSVIACFQLPLLSSWYATPLRWLIGATLAGLPRAVLLRLWLQRWPTSGQHLAVTLMNSPLPDQQRQGRKLYWRLVEQPVAMALGLLTCWSYLDLTTAYLLAPSGLPSGMVRLYNFMHFGRTSALSAEALILVMGPMAMLMGGWLIWRGFRA